MYAGQCVVSIIGCLSRCADLVESLKAEQERSSRTFTWKFWKRPEPSLDSVSFAEQARTLCDSIVDGANRLGQALEHRRLNDEDFHAGRFAGEWPHSYLLPPVTYSEANTAGDLLAIRVDLQRKLETPMQNKLDNETGVLGSELNAWKALLESLVSRALQDTKLPEDPPVNTPE